MSEDPYHAVQQEVQSSLQTALALRSSYVRIRNMAVREDNEELVWARNELKATLAALEADLEDMEESVKMVETTGARLFGLDEHEVQERRRYVSQVRREIEGMRAEVQTQPPPPAYDSQPSSRAGGRSPRPEDDQAEWARQEQQMMMAEQDRTMQSISGTLSTLAEQAGMMGQEISEHNELLEDLESGVDRSSSKLGGAMVKMKRLVQHTEQNNSGWCIIILIVVLLALLLAVILV